VNKIQEIAQAWLISLNPTAEQKAQARARLKICKQCWHKQDFPYEHCSICKCPIYKKIYSPVTNGTACPIGSW